MKRNALSICKKEKSLSGFYANFLVLVSFVAVHALKPSILTPILFIHQYV
jgi:hypothetical protein